MNFTRELRQRRVPQFTSAYLVGSWGVLQFFDFLEGRMTISPNLVSLIGLTLALLLPTVLTLAWVHGRPGKDEWGRTPKILVPANVVAVALLLIFVFHGRDLGAVTQTIEVQDENGKFVERVIPKSEFRRRVLLFYPEVAGSAADAWASETITYLTSLDIAQDSFIDASFPMILAASFNNAGHDDGHGLSRPLQRKLARDAHVNYFATGTLSQPDNKWQLDSQLYESESGKLVAEFTTLGPTLFSVADQLSLRLRQELGIPEGHLAESQDLPVADMTSPDILAVKEHVQALIAVTHANDWTAALKPLEAATERDETYALAQFLLFAVRQTLGDAAGASKAISKAMDNLYRIPERVGFLIKAQYYYNEKQDADKALAVLHMWTQIYPNDVTAYSTQATFMFIRQDIAGAIKALEKILEIDPSRVEYFEQLADFHAQLGHNEEAEAYLKRYIEIFPTRTDGYEELAEFYSNIGRLDEAREVLTQAQLIEPENIDLALGIIDLDVKQGAYQKCAAALAELMQDEPNQNAQVGILMAQVKLAARQGHTSQLIERTEAYHALSLTIQNPMQANIIYTMVLLGISNAGDPQYALNQLEETRTLIPKPYDDLVGVSESWILADINVAEATAKLTAAVAIIDMLKFETYRPTVMMIEGMIAEASGDLKGAVEFYQLAVDSAVGGRGTYRLRLVHALRILGEEKSAMKVLDDALQIDPMNPRFQLELAQLLYTQGDATTARKHLDYALAAWKTADEIFAPAQEARQLADRINAP